MDNNKVLEAKCGESISEFAKRIVSFCNDTSSNIIGKFNDVCVRVSPCVTEKYVVDYYWKHR